MSAFTKIVTCHTASIAGGQNVTQNVLPLRAESMLLRPAAKSLEHQTTRYARSKPVLSLYYNVPVYHIFFCLALRIERNSDLFYLRFHKYLRAKINGTGLLGCSQTCSKIRISYISKYRFKHRGFDDLTVVTIYKMSWSVMCSLIADVSGDTYCLHLRSRRLNQNKPSKGSTCCLFLAG